jgi:transcriptional regulator GlxA family with amidase domain
LNELSSTLRRQRKAGTILAACCTANYLLAGAGLLDGRAATTHWARASDFARRYPPVEVRARELLIEQEGIISGDSVTSYLNLAVRLVETCAGERLATMTAKALLIDMNRTSQRLLPPLSTTWADRQARRTAQQQMEATLQQGFRLSDLAAALAVSERTFNRRSKEAVGIPRSRICRICASRSRSACWKRGQLDPSPRFNNVPVSAHTSLAARECRNGSRPLRSVPIAEKANCLSWLLRLIEHLTPTRH